MTFLKYIFDSLSTLRTVDLLLLLFSNLVQNVKNHPNSDQPSTFVLLRLVVVAFSKIATGAN